MRITQLLTVALLGISAVTATTYAQTSQWVQFQKAEDAVAYRQASFRLMETHFSRLSKMASGTLPYDARLAMEDAAAVKMLSRLAFTAFVPNTAAPTHKSRSNDLVWSAHQRFSDSAQTLRVAADQMPVAVQAGDIGRLRKLASEAGSVCRKCHDQFRIR